MYNKVKIKTWEQMEKEFGLNPDGVIPCGGDYFTELMEKELPNDRIIVVSPMDDILIWRVPEGTWNITDAMIEEEINT